MNSLSGFIFLLLVLLITGTLSAQHVQVWDKYEIEIRNDKNYADPYTETELIVELISPDKSRKKLWGYYNGSNKWKLRCMPDKKGKWKYKAWFSDRPKKVFKGKFLCSTSNIPGLITADESNPVWFGFKGGKHLLMRSFHVGDRFFAANYPDSARNRFLDWLAQNKYNTISVASHYLNRDQTERGKGWSTPDLWDAEKQRPNPSAYTKMEVILDELAKRKIIVFPFAGFFGQGSDYPRDNTNQRLYVKYTLARLSAYWNIVYNVAGPEPTLSRLKQFNKDEINDLGRMIQSMNINGHLLTVHNEPHKNPFLNASWISFHCLQGASRHPDTLYNELLRGRELAKPVLAQEVLWYGNMYQTKNGYSDEDLRRNAFIINMAGAALNFGDNNGNSSTGFTGSLSINESHQDKHDIIKKVWDFFESIPFYELRPSPGAGDNGYSMSKPGVLYLTYLVKGGSVNLNTGNNELYSGEWIKGMDTKISISTGVTNGKNLHAPTNDDWLLYLKRVPQ